MPDLRLPIPPVRYDPRDEQERNAALEAADRNNIKRWDLDALLAVPMGELYFTTPAATTCTNQNEWYKCAGNTTLLTGFDHDMPADNRLRYTGTGARHAHMGCTVSMSGTGTNQTWEFALFVDGVLNPGSEISRFVGTGSDVGSTAMHSMAMMAPDSYVEVWARNVTSAGKEVTLEYCNLFSVAMRTR